MFVGTVKTRPTVIRVVREFVVSEAPRDRVAALTRATVEDVGGVVAQATERTTEFDHLEPTAGDWSRSGYVGTYKRYGEPPIRLRIRVWAEWPRKLFLWSVFLGLVQAVLFFSLAFVGLSPPSNVWIFTAIITFALIAIGLLMYTSSWADSREIEDEIARRLTARLADDEEVPGDVYTLGEWEAYRARVVDGAVEGAEPEAPQRPSRTKRVLGRVGIVSGEDDDAEADEPEEEPAVEAGPDDDEDTGDEDSSLLDRVAFWRSSEEDEEDGEDEPDEEPEEEPEEEPAAETEPDETEEDPDEEADDEDEAEDDEDGLLDRLAFWRSPQDDDEEEPDETEDAEDEEEAPDEEPLEAEEEADEDAEDSGLLDRIAFWKGSDDEEPDDEADDENGGASDGGAEGEEDPAVAEKRKRLEELKRKKEAAEADESG